MKQVYKLCLSTFAAACLFFLTLSFTGCDKENLPKLDINEYIVIETSGYDEYGSVSFSIDYKSMVLDCVNDDSIAADTIDLANTFEPFTAEYDESNTLRNGDMIEVKWKRNNEVVEVLENTLQIDFVSDPYEYTVTGLYETEEYNPFDDLCMETNGTASGNGSIDFYINCKIKGQSPIIMNVEHNSTNGSMKNGETIHLTLSDEIDYNEFTRTTGMKIIQTEMDYTIDCLCVPATDNTIFEKIADSTKENFDTVIEEWVVTGLNDKSASTKYPRTYDNVGYIYYTNTVNADSSDSNNGMLFAIYEISDVLVLEPYYVFIGIAGNFTANQQRVYLNGTEFSDSFVDYKKETVRYTQDLGWGQGQKKMGFLVNGMPYAGHLKIQETIGFIRETYGNNYENEFVSENITQLIELNNTESNH